MAPPHVLCAVYPVCSIEEAAALYHHFDSRVAVDTSADDLSGAFRSIEFQPKCQLFRTYKGTLAIKRATQLMAGLTGSLGSLDIYKAAPLWREQLLALDSIDATYQRFNNIILTAALLTIRRRGDVAIECWDRYQRDAGTKTETTLDGIEAISRMRADNPPTGRAFDRIIGKVISFLEIAVDGRMITLSKGLKGTSLTRYVAGMQRERAPFVAVLAKAGKIERRPAATG
jgi:hypothetical protein